MARTTALNIRRREARQRKHAAARAAVPASAAEPPAADDAARLRAALAALPDRYRLPLELVYLDGLTGPEAAARLGVPAGTVRSHLKRGLERLRAALGLAAGAVVPAAAGGRSVPAEWAAGAVAAAARVRPRPAGLVALVAARWAGGPAAGWAVAAGVLACGAVGVALVLAGGLVAAPADPPAPPPPPDSPRPVARAAEPTLQERNERVFRADFAPRIAALVGPMVLNDGEVVVTPVAVHDFRILCEIELRHRDPPPGMGTARVRVLVNTNRGTVNVRWDEWGTGVFRQVDVNRMIVIPVPGTKREVAVPSRPLQQVVELLRTFPPDPRAASAEAAHAAAVATALIPYRGMWFTNERPPVRKTFGLHPKLDPGGDVDLSCGPGDGPNTPLEVILLHPDGRLENWFFDRTYVLSADGRRIDVPGTDQWWTRADP